MRQSELSDGSYFVRLWLRGPHAKAVLMDLLQKETRRFHRKYAALPGSGAVYATTGDGWCAILAGRALASRSRPKSVRRAAWSPSDLDRLREVYDAEGMTGCVRAFPERTYQGLACALKRHKITTGRRRAEAMTW